MFFLYGVITPFIFSHIFCCYFLPLGSNNCAMQIAYVKTSISMPAEMLAWAKAESVEQGHLPLSRIIAQAVREKMERAAKSKTKGGARK